MASGKHLEVYVQNFPLAEARSRLFGASPFVEDGGGTVKLWECQQLKMYDLHGHLGTHIGIGDVCFFKRTTGNGTVEYMWSTIGGFVGSRDGTVVYMMTAAHNTRDGTVYYRDSEMQDRLGVLTHRFMDADSDIAFIKVDDAHQNKVCNILKMRKLDTEECEFYNIQISEENLTTLAKRKQRIVRHGPGNRGQAYGCLAVVHYKKDHGGFIGTLGIIPDERDGTIALPGDSGSLLSSPGGEQKLVEAFGLLVGNFEAIVKGDSGPETRHVGVITSLSLGIEKLKRKDSRLADCSCAGLRSKHMDKEESGPDSGYSTQMSPSQSTFFTASILNSTS